MRLNGSVPTNKRNGLAISRIDEEYCFIRADKTERVSKRKSVQGWGGEKQDELDGGGEQEGEKKRKKETCLIKFKLKYGV